MALSLMHSDNRVHRADQQWGGQTDLSADMTGLKHAGILRGDLQTSEEQTRSYTIEIAVPFSFLPASGALFDVESDATPL